MTRKLAFCFLISALSFVACQKRETPAPPPKNVPPPQTATTTPPPTVPPLRKSVRSTPQKCAGDGSYEQALDCFRMAAKLRFNVDAPVMVGDGELTRPRIGEEHVALSLRDGQWIADVHPTGIVWTRDGKTATPSPDMERLEQRLTLFLDPQKKEGAAQLVGTEPMAGVTMNHYHFTDANNGDVYDVWISTADGHIVQMKVGPMRLTFR